MKGIAARPRSDRHQLQQIVAGLTEGIILVDPDQKIVWANEAALVMHGVSRLTELGTTADAYRSRFQLQCRNNHRLSKGSYPIERVIAGEAFRDVVVEVTPPGASDPQWVHRVRSLVLTHETGEPDCLALILSNVTEEFEAEERFESSFNVNPAPAVICRLADRLFIKVNTGFLRLSGLSRREVIGCHFDELDPFGTCPHREAALSMMMRGEPVPQYESSLRVAKNGSKPVIVAGQPIDIDGQSCILFTFVDLGPIREAEEQLRISRERSQANFETLYKTAPIASYSLDDRGRLLGVSDRWLGFLGYSREAVIGQPITAYMTKECAEDYVREDRRGDDDRMTSQDKETCFVKADGVLTETLLSSCAMLDSHGVPCGRIGVLVDISARKHSEERFEKLFRLAPIPMLVTSLHDLSVLDVNQAFLELTGRRREAVVGVTSLPGLCEATSPQGGNHTGVQADFAAGKTIRDVELNLLISGGGTCAVLLSSETINLSQHRCALLVFQDLSDRRKSEGQLYEAIEAVMQDTSWFSRTVIEKLASVRAPRPSTASTHAIEDLSNRERQILGQMSEGMKDEEISRLLGLSKSTVRNHVAAIYAKIDVHSRSAAVIWARQRGLTSAPTASRPSRKRPLPD